MCDLQRKDAIDPLWQQKTLVVCSKEEAELMMANGVERWTYPQYPDASKSKQSHFSPILNKLVDFQVLEKNESTAYDSIEKGVQVPHQ